MKRHASDPPPDFQAALDENPNAHSFYARLQLQYGGLSCLAEHIRRSDFHIHPQVAQEILALIDGSSPYYELAISRRSDLPAASKGELRTLARDAKMTMAVEQLSGFKRGLMKGAFHEVGKEYGLHPDYVRKRVQRFRSMTRKL